jgi:Protein of unknown function (DUF2992)
VPERLVPARRLPRRRAGRRVLVPVVGRSTAAASHGWSGGPKPAARPAVLAAARRLVVPAGESGAARAADARREDDVNSTTFTVFFAEPFWVGILEIRDDNGVRAARRVFGDEPSGAELYAFGLSRDYDRLLRRAVAGRPVPSPPRPRPVNSKRAARAAAKERKAPPASTAAHQAIQAALQKSKTYKRSRSRTQRLAQAARRRELARAKAKARHRGR